MSSRSKSKPPAPKPTTINLDPAVRDRLKGFCGGGITYSEAVQRLMDQVEADRFYASFRDAMDDPNYPWIEDKDMKWD